MSEIDEFEALLNAADDALTDSPVDKQVSCPVCGCTKTVPLTRRLTVCPDCIEEWRQKYTDKYNVRIYETIGFKLSP